MSKRQERVRSAHRARLGRTGEREREREEAMYGLDRREPSRERGWPVVIDIGLMSDIVERQRSGAVDSVLGS